MNIKKISKKELSELIEKSREYPRRRAIKIFQEDSYKGVQVCLNIIQTNSYIRPHLRYKDQIIIYNSGELSSLEFDRKGNIKRIDKINKNSPFLFVQKNTFHTIISLKKNSSIWLITKGSHNKNNFSKYLKNSPREDEKYYRYFKFLRSQLTIFNRSRK